MKKSMQQSYTYPREGNKQYRLCRRHLEHIQRIQFAEPMIQTEIVTESKRKCFFERRNAVITP